jgi:competence protein ComEC
MDRGTARERARTWPQGRARVLAGAIRLPALDVLAQHLVEAFRAAAVAEAGPGRLVPWIPVACGIGIAVYFAAEREPSWIAALLLAGALTAAAFVARLRAAAFAALVLIGAAAIGFAVATLKTALIAHPVLERPLYGASITGFIETREERERTDRIVVKVSDMDGDRVDFALERVRLSVRRGAAPAVGSFVRLKARLNPPPPPFRPGGYDFARDLYFQRIGATGFVTGAIKVEAAPVAPGLRLRFLSAIDAMRDGIDRRIRAVVPGDAGAIASALITGKRDALSTAVNDAMFISGLGHVLSISGYHMAVVAGVVFFVFRAGLALIPGIALRHPIKKWGALAALLAATFYLVLSGAEVATQRSFIMIAIVLIGVMVDRSALTLRNLALAALFVMVLAPESVVHPSFQMSFAATLALVAAYQGGGPWSSGGKPGSFAAQAASWGLREITTLVLASLVAGLATTPYAAFHFHRLAPYGVIANLLAMPIVSVWVMPAGLLALLAMPFGFDGPLWHVMGQGIEWMDAVALWVASLPGAVGRIPAFGIGALVAATAGLVLICLLRTRLRWSGIVLVIVAIVMAWRTPQPHVLISANADLVAVRGADGHLSALRNGSDVLALREWLSADGDPRAPTDPGLKEGFNCDAAACIAHLPDNSVVSIARTAHGLVEDCDQASLVVTPREVPPQCRALAIDRRKLGAGGAVALHRVGNGWSIQAAVPPGSERPWARNAGHTRSRNSPVSGTDVTPRTEDLGADD